jgi:hypothetical protein
MVVIETMIAIEMIKMNANTFFLDMAHSFNCSTCIYDKEKSPHLHQQPGEIKDWSRDEYLTWSGDQVVFC